MSPLLTILHITELSACATGFIYYKKISRSYFKWFPLYLLFVVLSEATGELLHMQHMNKANQNYFNYFEIPVEFLFFFWLFYKSFDKHKWLPILFAAIYPLTLVLDVYYLRQGGIFYNYSYTAGILFMLVLVLLFFIRLVNSDHILTFWKNMLFWISLGMLIYYLVSLPFYALRNVVGVKYHDLYNHYWNGVLMLNSFMYLMFTASFIWGKPNTST